MSTSRVRTLVALVAVAGLIAGCGSSSTGAATSSRASTLGAAPAQSAGSSAAPESAPASSAAQSALSSAPPASAAASSAAVSPVSSAAADSSGAVASSAPQSSGAAPSSGAAVPDPGAASAGDPTKAAYTPTGPLIADDGFRPAADGFAFQNYGAVPAGGTNMIAADVQKIFGDGVCADTKGGKCNLTPEAQNWMDQTNAAMSGGHCFGFAVATQLLWQNAGLKPSDFGAATAPALQDVGNDALQRQIAVNWAYQVLDSVNAAKVKGTPNDIIAALKKALVKNPTELYTVAIFNATGGHAVTPYALEDAGNGIVNILVYDNNWPGVTRAIKVDTTANTWSYLAALNPAEKAELYQGDATTQNLLLYPTTNALKTQPCPFCGKVQAPASGLKSATGAVVGSAATADATGVDDIYLTAESDTTHGHLLITNPSGQRIGYVDGKVVNEIPGASMIQPMSDESWLVDQEPDYHVPDGVTYTITIDGTDLTAADKEAVGVIGPSSDVEVNAIDLQPGEKDTMVAGPNATELSYTASSTQTPTFEIAVSDAKADYNFTVSGQADQAGSTTKLGLPETGGTLSIDTADSAGASNFDLTMSREDDNGELDFNHNDIELAAGDTATLQFGSWTADGESIPLVLDQNGTHTTQTLTDATG